MQVIPAIDLMNGIVVRLTRGDPDTAKAYGCLGAPTEIAKRWKTEGAERLHIIDLDAAFGRGDNLKTVAKIAEATKLPIQIGGGIRTVEAAEKLLSAGIGYVILGALAFSNPTAITQIQAKFSREALIVALDHRGGKVMIEGWKTATAFGLMEALEKFARLGVKTFLITSITRDGMLQGPDLDTLTEACKYPNVEILAAGGIGSLNDLVAPKHIGVEGAAIGKGVYDGKFTLKEAIKTVKEN